MKLQKRTLAKANDLKKLIQANESRGISASELRKVLGLSSDGLKNLLEYLELKNPGQIQKFVLDGRKIPKDKVLVGLPKRRKSTIAKNKKKSDTTPKATDAELKNTAEVVDETVKSEKQSEQTEEPQNTDNQLPTSCVNLNFYLDEISRVEPKPDFNIMIDTDKGLNQLTINELAEFVKRKSADYNVKFWLFEEQIYIMDNAKKTGFYNDFIKTIAILVDESKVKLIPGTAPKKEELVSYCLAHNLCLITTVPQYIAKMRLKGGMVYIPEKARQKYPNPFKGQGLVGLDTNACFGKEENILNGKNQLLEIFKQYSNIVFSDIQLEELVSGYMYVIIAYYGILYEAQKANGDFADSSDWQIVNFYREHHVDMLYTFDYGFYIFANVAKINCKLLSKHTESCKIYLAMQESSNDESTIAVGKELFVDATVRKNGDCIWLSNNHLNRYVLSVFDSRKRKVKGMSGFYKIKNDAYLSVKLTNEDHIIVCQVKDVEYSSKGFLGKIVYNGPKRGCPFKD